MQTVFKSFRARMEKTRSLIFFYAYGEGMKGF